MPQQIELPDSAAINRAIHRMAEDIETRLADDLSNAVLVGIYRGGIWVAQHLQQHLQLSEPVATASVMFHRDDYSQRGLVSDAQPSNIPPLDDRCVILVDEVLFTGRTVRAAMNELFDFGRPARILLATLVDRGGRQIPVQPDFTGFAIDLPPPQRIKLSGPETLSFSLESGT